MVTGGSDSRVKLWTDSTAEEEQRLKEEKLALVQEEQLLSKHLRENELIEASILAFKLNRIRDFFHAMNRLVCGNLVPPRAYIPGLMLPGVAAQTVDKTRDPIESIMLSKRSFEQTVETGQPQIDMDKTNAQVKKVISMLLVECKGDTCRLLEMVRKLNAR